MACPTDTYISSISDILLKRAGGLSVDDSQVHASGRMEGCTHFTMDQGTLVAEAMHSLVNAEVSCPLEERYCWSLQLGIGGREAGWCWKFSTSTIVITYFLHNIHWQTAQFPGFAIKPGLSNQPLSFLSEPVPRIYRLPTPPWLSNQLGVRIYPNRSKLVCCWLLRLIGSFNDW